MTPKERAQHAALVRWGKKNPLAARVAAARLKRKAKAGGAKPAAPKAPKETPEQREERRKARLAEADARRKAREDERAKAKADKEKADAAEKEKKKGGGGGGGGGAKKPEEADKDKAKAEARSKAAQETARVAGMKPGDVDELRKAAETGGARSDALRKAGLVDANGDATDQGRRALGALERGDVRGYRAALQDATARMGRESAAQQRKDKSAQDKTRREGERTAKDKAKADADAQELRDLADDFKRGRRGLSMQEQRRLAKAGLGAHDDRGKFSVKAWRWASDR